MNSGEYTQAIDRRGMLWLTAVIGAALILGLALTRLGPVSVIGVLAGASLAVAALIYAEWSILALVLLTYLNFFDVLSRQGGPSLEKPFIAFLFAAALLHWFVQRQRPPGLMRPLLLIGSYGVVALLGVAYARDLNAALRALIQLASALLIACTILLILRKVATLKRVAWMLLTAGIFLGSIVVHQYLSGNFGDDYLGFGRGEIKQVTRAEEGFRSAGPIGDSNFFAQIMLVLIPLAVERMLHERNLVLRLAAGSCAVLSFLSVIFSFSRGGFLSMLVIAVLIVILMRPRRSQVLTVAVFLLPFLFLAPGRYRERMASIVGSVPGISQAPADLAIRGRTSELKTGLMMFADHPLLGVGIGNYPEFYQQYSRDVGLDPRLADRSAHSLYLQIASESGILGLFIFVFIVIAMFRGLRKARTNFFLAGRKDAASMTTAFTVSIAGYLAAALFLHAAYPRFLWLLIAIAFAIPNVARNELEFSNHASRNVIHEQS